MKINIKQLVREHWAFKISKLYINYPIEKVEFILVKRFVTNNSSNYIYSIIFNYWNNNSINKIIHYCFISTDKNQIELRQKGKCLDKENNAKVDLAKLLNESQTELTFIKI